MKSLSTIVAVPVVIGAVLLGGCERRTPESADATRETAPFTTAPGTTAPDTAGTTPGGMGATSPSDSTARTDPSASGTGMGGTGLGTSDTGAANMAALDRDFLEATARSNLAEIEASRSAAERANNPAIRTYAETMLRDYTALGQELRALASRKGIVLPTAALSTDAAELERIRNARGAEFDRMYVDHLGASAHKETIELFERAASQASDPDIKAFAAEKLPTLRTHLAMAERLPAQSKG